MVMSNITGSLGAPIAESKRKKKKRKLAMYKKRVSLLEVWVDASEVNIKTSGRAVHFTFYSSPFISLLPP